MRVLFTSYPLLGHLNPVLPFARAASRAGHEVAVAVGADLVPYVERRGLPAWAVGPTHAEASGGGPPSVRLFPDSAEKRAANLVPRALRWAPDLVVSEEFELAGSVAAALVGTRYVVHGLGMMPPLPIWSSLAPAVERLHEQWHTAVGVDDVRDATYLELCPPSLRPAGDRVWHRTRPLRPVAGEPVGNERLPDELGALPYDDTVHLTLGTLFHDDVGVLDTALAGLRELPVNVVVTTGPGTAPSRLGPQPAHVLALPHALLLPRCRLVVSQGGAGIMFGAIAHGLPQLMLPQGADQFLNAVACTSAGVALALYADALTPGAVASATTRLLREPEFTEAAAVLRTEIAAMPSADEVLAFLIEES